MSNNVIVKASAELKKTFGFGHTSKEERLHHPVIEIRRGLSGKIGVAIKKNILSTSVKGR